MPKPKPVFEFYSIPGGKEPISHPPVSESVDIRRQWIDQFFKAKNLAATTTVEYRRELESFLGWTDKTLPAVTGRDIANYKHHLELLKDSRGTSKRSAASVAVAIAALKSWFKWLVSSGYLESNPTAGVTIPAQKKPEPKHLDDAEVAALYAELAKSGETRLRDTAILAVLEHGLRAREVSRLNVGDYSQARIYIREAKQDSTGWVPLAPDACIALDAYLGERQQRGDNLDDSQPLFLSHSLKPGLSGKRLGYDGIYKLVKELGERAGIPNCHPHRLRHTFATRLVLMGIDSYLARKLTRHESERVFRRYSEHGRAIAAENAYRDAISRQR